MEALTGGCCEKENKYTVFASHDDGAETLLEAVEKSNGCARVCLKPYNALTLHVKDTAGNVLLTVDRPGKECCSPSLCGPKPCLGCFACTDICTDGVNVYDGLVEGDPGNVSGTPISSIKQQGGGGGGCTPTLIVDEKEDGSASGFIEGPMCFGGWSECCCESDFKYSTTRGKSGDIAVIKHLKPKDCGGACREACTDSDNFGVEFMEGITAEQKADALAGALLVDYMFFEIDQGLCHCEDGKIIFTCFLCYCYGCLCPCNITCAGKDQAGGAPPAPEDAVGGPFMPDSAAAVGGTAMERS